MNFRKGQILSEGKEGDWDLAGLEVICVRTGKRESGGGNGKFPGFGLRIRIPAAERACLATKDTRGG